MATAYDHNSSQYAFVLHGYLTTGDDSVLVREFAHLKSPKGGWLVPDVVLNSQVWDAAECGSQAKSEVYAMPAATQAMLSDPKCDLWDWLASELRDSFMQQAGPYRPQAYGPLSVLRDPYSLKPYVLFYCVAPLRVDALQPKPCANCGGSGVEPLPLRAPRTVTPLSTHERFTGDYADSFAA